MSTTDRGRALHDFFLKGLPKDGIVQDCRSTTSAQSSTRDTTQVALPAVRSARTNL